MPVLADFSTIIGDNIQIITHVERDFKFPTGGRTGGNAIGSQAVITFDVQGLRSNVPVKVNGVKVGILYGYPNTPEFQKSWFSQKINLWGSRLKDGFNVLELEAHPGDSFKVKSVYCFFHQRS